MRTIKVYNRNENNKLYLIKMNDDKINLPLAVLAAAAPDKSKVMEFYNQHKDNVAFGTYGVRWEGYYLPYQQSDDNGRYNYEKETSDERS